MSNKKVLFISYDGMTDPLGQSQVLPYLSELSSKGYAITLLSFEKKDRYGSEKAIIEEIAKRASIKWTPLFFTSKPPIVSKMYDRWQMLRKAKQLYRKERFDIIHCRSYVAAEAGLKLKRLYGTRFLFDMRGFWADEKVDNGQWNLGKWVFKKIYAHYKKKEKEFLLEADGIVCLTQAAKKYLMSRPGYEKLSIEVIPCCADLDHFNFNRISPQQKFKLKKELGIPENKKIILYLGSIGSWYMTDEMFAFYKRLIIKHPDYCMLILTKDSIERVEKEGMMAGIDPGNLIVRYANRNEVPGYISISNCSIFFIRPTFSKMASSPTKHAELMGMGIPVICNDIGDTGEIIKTTGTGLLVKHFSLEEYDRVAGQFPGLICLQPEKIREAAFYYFDLKKGSEKYSSLYHQICN